MAPWLLPALKAVLPHVGTLITVAAPVFTKKSAEAAGQAQLLQQQIAELQSAATLNAQNIKALAEQMQQTHTALQQAAEVAEIRLRRALLLALGAAAVAAAALGVAVLQAFAR